MYIWLLSSQITLPITTQSFHLPNKPLLLPCLYFYDLGPLNEQGVLNHFPVATSLQKMTPSPPAANESSRWVGPHTPFFIHL